MPADPRLARQIVVWVLLALAIGAAVGMSGLRTPRPMPGWWLVALLLAAVVASGVAHVRVSIRGTVEATTLNEIGVIPLMVLLPPEWAVATGFVGCLVAELLLTRAQLPKLLFNLAWQTAAIASGSWLYHTVASGHGSFAASGTHLAGALLAGFVFVTVNLIAITGVFSVASRRSWWATLVDEVPSSLVLNVGAALTGLLVAVLIVAAPLALPLLVLPALLNHGRARARSEGFDQIAAERDRFQRTVAGSSDGVVLLDDAGRVEVWNPAMVELTGRAENLAVGATLEELGLAHLTAPARSPSSGGHRIAMAGRVVEVRRADRSASAAPTGESVLALRDVSREAELARIRDDLVARISHELRTPLTTVEGFLETLELSWGELTEEQRQRMVTAARRGTHRLGTLVANLVTWDRIGADPESTRPPARSEVASPEQVIRELLPDLDLPEPLLLDLDAQARARIAPAELRIMLSNLLINAALYGAPPLHVIVGTVGDTVRIVVADRGPGLPDEFRPHLFEPFGQATRGLRRTSRGLGIGLMIVRSLAIGVGGTAIHEDPPEGGARFTVTLPAAARPSPPPAAGPPGTRSSESSGHRSPTT